MVNIKKLESSVDENTEQMEFLSTTAESIQW